MRRGRADDPAVDGDDRLAPGRPGRRRVATLAVDGHPAGGDHRLGAAPRGDARPRRGPSGAARPPSGAGRRSASASARRRTRRSLAVEQRLGHRLAALLREARGDVDVERRQVVEARQPEALEELEARAVQERPAGRVRPAQLDDEPAVQQRADRVVGVDAADALDGRLA